MYMCVCVFVYTCMYINAYMHTHVYIFDRRAYYVEGSRQGLRREMC